MDPVTHTFVGLAFAAGLERRSPLATAALVIGANLPDIDVVAYVGGSDHALFVRRGSTHGLLALVVLPLALTLGLVAVDRWRRRRNRPADAPLRLLVLSSLAVLSHPLLDWLNTYGVRFLMPFDGTWFYGDALFIIDPWVWLSLGGALFVIHSRSWRGRLNWAVVALLTSAAVLAGAGSESGARWLWLLGIGAWIAVRWRFGEALLADGGRRLARLVLAGVGFYMAMMVATTAIARQEVGRALAATQLEVERFMVGPVMIDPVPRMAVVETPTEIRFGIWDPRATPCFRLEGPALPRLQTRRVEAARGARCVRGMVNWTRYPFYEIEPLGEDGDGKDGDGGTVVHILDARYVRGRTSGFGATSVVLDAEDRPSGCDPPPI